MILSSCPEGNGSFILSREKWQPVLWKSPLARISQALKPPTLLLKMGGGGDTFFWILLAVFYVWLIGHLTVFLVCFCIFIIYYNRYHLLFLVFSKKIFKNSKYKIYLVQNNFYSEVCNMKCGETIFRNQFCFLKKVFSKTPYTLTVVF